jgi:hypothetical protein
LVKRMATRAQKDQLDGGSRTAGTPKFLVDRGDVAGGQRELLLDIELRQTGGQAVSPHIAKFQARHLPPPSR